MNIITRFFNCFDAVCLVIGRQKVKLQQLPKVSFGTTVSCSHSEKKLSVKQKWKEEKTIINKVPLKLFITYHSASNVICIR